MSKAKRSPRPRAPSAVAVAKAERAAARATEKVAKLTAELEKARAKAAGPKTDPPPAGLTDFTSPPADPLHAQAELHRMLVISAYDAATDPNISSAERRKELRTITAAAAKMLPDSRRWEAEQLIKSNRAELEKRASEKRGAKLEKRAR